MANYKTFQELPIWQEARLLTKEIYGLTAMGSFSNDFGLKDQIQRASVSIMSNIADEARQCEDGQRLTLLARSITQGERSGCPMGKTDRNGFERRSNKVPSLRQDRALQEPDHLLTF